MHTAASRLDSGVRLTAQFIQRTGYERMGGVKSDSLSTAIPMLCIYLILFFILNIEQKNFASTVPITM